MSSYILLSEKEWHVSLFEQLKKQFNKYEWYLIRSKEEFTVEKLKSINPDKIFIPHWSYIIDESIYNKYECVVFHMTDLPYGRGGSPLQNLIVNGHKKTRISAIKVEKGIDTGAIYLKKSLSLDGTAREIFERSVPIVQQMISEIIEQKLVPQPQVGESTVFARRKPEDSDLSKLDELEKIYDYIRMLDCEGYPNAFLETETFKVDFTKAKINDEQQFIEAHVRIYKK